MNAESGDDDKDGLISDEEVSRDKTSKADEMNLEVDYKDEMMLTNSFQLRASE